MTQSPVPDAAALALFERLQPFHDLGEQEQLVLEKAVPLLEALLHAGELRKRKAVSAAEELVQAQAEELAPEERRLLAAVLALAAAPLKDRALETLALSPNQLRQARALAALLKLGAALSPDGAPLHLKKVERTPAGLWVRLEATPPEAGTAAAPKAAAALAAAQGWRQAGYAPLYLVEESQAGPQWDSQSPLPTPRTSPGILATDTLAEAGRKVWRQHLAEMLRQEPGTRRGDVEALHDMRVATRRMRAAFDVFGPAFKPKTIRPIRNGLRMAGRALGRVRDLDVLLEHAQAYLESLPPEERGGLDPLLDTWREERESARDDLLGYLSSREYHEFIWDFNAFLQTPEGEEGEGEDEIETPEPNRVREVAPVLIYTRLGEARAYERILADASVDQLHALRIEFKRLRYCLEFFREGLGEEDKTLIDILKNLQDHLGELHDAEVGAGLIQGFLVEHPVGPQAGGAVDSTPYTVQPNLAPVAAYLASRYTDRHLLLTTFPDAWRSFNSPEFRHNLALAVAEL